MPSIGLPAYRRFPPIPGTDVTTARPRRAVRPQGPARQELLANGQNVIMESGHWTREQRDEKRLVARALGVTVELRNLDVPFDELHRPDREADNRTRLGLLPKTAEQLDGWATLFQPPDATELALFDVPTKLAGPSFD